MCVELSSFSGFIPMLYENILKGIVNKLFRLHGNTDGKSQAVNGFCIFPSMNEFIEPFHRIQIP